jgi:hypothetical protein
MFQSVKNTPLLKLTKVVETIQNINLMVKNMEKVDWHLQSFPFM